MLLLFHILVYVVIVKANESPHGKQTLFTLSDDEVRSLDPSIIEDMILDVTGLIMKYGYPVEEHEVETDDGYLLTMHRIPHLKNSTTNYGTPVLLMHGLLSSSTDWIINGPQKALGYILSDRGFDVWMGNARGNYYSRKHKTLDPYEKNFWNFSWNEIGYYDLPAMIDYILKTNGQKRLHYIGHSQGTTSFYVMCSNRRNYNKYIITMHSLAPVAYVNNAKNPFIKFVTPFLNTITWLTEHFGHNEFLPSSNTTKMLAEVLCSDDKVMQKLCSNVIFLICGPTRLNNTMLPVYISHAPAGASTKQVIHYIQTFASGKFRQYDHGKNINKILYNSTKPPDYKLKNIMVPIYLYFSENDWLSDPIDVYRLSNKLPNVKEMYKISFDNFNHLDFLWGINSKTLVYDNILKILDENINGRN